jgi:hypothetical protein
VCMFLVYTIFGGNQTMQQTESLRASLTCTFCLDIFFQPVTAPCGHTFCRDCVASALRTGKKSCPLCRTPILPSSVDTINYALSDIIKQYFPDQSAEREAESSQHIKTALDHLHLFTFDTIPGMSCTVFFSAVAAADETRK